jgi:DNA-directed RNA polymerase subunit RPC12/RpoP
MTEEAPAAEAKVRDIVEFCLECSWTNDKPKGLVSCPACGGKVIRQKRELIAKARQDNRNKRGV